MFCWATARYRIRHGPQRIKGASKMGLDDFLAKSHGSRLFSLLAGASARGSEV